MFHFPPSAKIRFGRVCASQQYAKVLSKAKYRYTTSGPPRCKTLLAFQRPERAQRAPITCAIPSPTCTIVSSTTKVAKLFLCQPQMSKHLRLPPWLQAGVAGAYLQKGPKLKGIPPIPEQDPEAPRLCSLKMLFQSHDASP
jgi:hypothetical protein